MTKGYIHLFTNTQNVLILHTYLFPILIIENIEDKNVLNLFIEEHCLHLIFNHKS